MVMELFILGCLFILIIALKYATQPKAQEDLHEKVEYAYTAKQFIMTRNESEFFNLLNEILQDKYNVFPQIHLSAILDEKIKGQNWKGALSSIDRKSVDFVICDKQNQKILVAIELDDSTHERPDRVIRDEKVESILEKAGIKLLRFKINTPHTEIFAQLRSSIESLS